jgi:hypothetical protein
MFKDYTDKRIAKIVGCCASTVYRFRKGEIGSYYIAKWMADNLRGEYKRLYADCLQDRREGKVERINGITRHPKWKPATKYRRLTVATIRSLIATTLPVVHPQDEVYWS